jgi:hypothetical protein
LRHLLSQFTPIPTLLRKITGLQKESGAEIAHEMTQMQLDPSFQLMDKLVADTAIVYSPPKVGGQTIAATIRAHPHLPEPKHIHFLSDRGLAFMDSLVDRCRTPLYRQRWYECITQSRWVRTLLAMRTALRAAGLASIVPKPVFIAGVREPVAQYISLVFEHWWMYADSPDALTADSIAAQMRDDPWLLHCNDWFVNELHEMFGLDLLERPFPTERGWDVYENDVARVLIVRQENLDRLPEALGNLCGIDPATVVVEVRNVAEAKDYSAHYESVKKAWRSSELDMTALYSQPHVRHFYAKEEIARFQERWRSGADEFPAAPSKRKEMPCGPGEGTASRQNQEDVQHRNVASPLCGSSKHPNHGKNCLPCAHCVEEMRLIPVLRHACEERLELIQKLHAALRTRPLREKLLGVFHRLFRTARTA